MVLSRNYQLLCIMSFAITTLFFFSFTFLPPKSAGGMNAIARNYEDEAATRKMVLGSRPPGCVNKCMNCHPCQATLVIPPHKNVNGHEATASHSHSKEDNDTYYLLSWKCRCGNKLYQP